MACLGDDYYCEIGLASDKSGTFFWQLYINRGEGRESFELIASGHADSPYRAFVAAQEAHTDQHALEPRIGGTDGRDITG